MKVTQVKSKNGANHAQRETLRSLGLRKIGRSAEREDQPALRGVIHSVRHLVEVTDAQ